MAAPLGVGELQACCDSAVVSAYRMLTSSIRVFSCEGFLSSSFAFGALLPLTSVYDMPVGVWKTLHFYLSGLCGVVRH